MPPIKWAVPILTKTQISLCWTGVAWAVDKFRKVNGGRHPTTLWCQRDEAQSLSGNTLEGSRIRLPHLLASDFDLELRFIGMDNLLSSYEWITTGLESDIPVGSGK